MGVKHRQRVQEYVVTTESPRRAEFGRVDADVRMRQRDPFRLSGRAGGIQQRREIVAIAVQYGMPAGGLSIGVAERAAAVAAQRQDIPYAECRADVRGVRGIVRITHDQCRFGVREEILEFAARVRGVQRVEHKTTAQAPEVQQNIVDGLAGLYRYPVTDPDPERDEAIGDLCAQRIERCVGEPIAFGGGQKYIVAAPVRGEPGVQVVVAHRKRSVWSWVRGARAAAVTRSGKSVPS